MKQDYLYYYVHYYGIIYEAYNKMTGKRYIGQTIQKLITRINGHYHADSEHLTYFDSILQNSSRENWIWKIIDNAQNADELNLKEIYWIKFFNSTDKQKGYNISTGGSSRFRGEAYV